ncbi:MAG TPA: quinone oxidoreductase [Anaerolineaceae bacterium]
MHVIRVHQYGAADQLKYEEVPVADPKPGEARVKVAASGVNFVEVYQRKGIYSNPLPLSLGAEFAGVVDALGEGVTDLKVGDQVATANGMGGYAEYAYAPAGRLVRVPPGVTLEQAAALMLQGITAHYLAYSTFPLKPGHTALMHAAGGGVGQLLVQIGKRCGARVIATASTEEKARLAREAGADEVILYTSQDFEAETKRLTAGAGVDVVYDGVGKTTFAQGLNCLKPRGYMVLYGQASGPVDPVNPQILNQKGSLFLTRPTIAHYVLTREELLWRAEDILGWLAAGSLKLHIDRTFPLREAAAAHQYLEDRQTKGKVLLIA